MISAAEAITRLRDGNRRFVDNQTTAPALSSHTRRVALVAGQAPFAIVLGCSDSRVPAELVFDQPGCSDAGCDPGQCSCIGESLAARF